MKEYLLTAGPTPVPDRVLQAMARPMLYHRSPPFTECLREVQDGLRWLLQTKQLPMLMSGSGTVGMDAAVCNFLHTGDKAVVIRGGKFGERWGKICEAYGIECVYIDVEWGKGVDPKAVAKAIDDNPGVRAVYATACETSTATKHDVEAVAKVKNGNELVQRVLEEINRSIREVHEKTLGEYRAAYESRHRILNGFMPFWRSLEKTLARADQRITSLNDRASRIDAQMEKFEEIVAHSEKAEHALTVSALSQLAVATLVLAIAAGGALINYKLIALPMSEMVGAGDYITSSLRTSEVAALVIILVEASMGLFLLEALRITHLFPRIANLNDVMRRRILWIALTLLVTLARVEAALALMRDMLIADKQALLQSLATAPQPAPTGGSPMPRAPTGVSGSGMSRASILTVPGMSMMVGGLLWWKRRASATPYCLS